VPKGGSTAPSPTPDKDLDIEDLLQAACAGLHTRLLMRSTDIKICRTPEGKKCRLGEGGFGVVYKAIIHGVDEVAVKLAKVRFDQIWGEGG
jgi:hypothetical protein